MIIIKSVEKNIMENRFDVVYYEYDATDNIIKEETISIPYHGIDGQMFQELSKDYFKHRDSYYCKTSDFVAEYLFNKGNDSSAVIEHLREHADEKDFQIIPEEPKRKLATVQVISNIEPIVGADKIEVATVMGWKVVVAKGLHKVGDKIVYCEVDSCLPIKPQYEFLRKSSLRKHIKGMEVFRIKTCKLRGQISQGLIIPLTELPDTKEYVIGEDVTEDMGIIKWEVDESKLSGICKGNFPVFLHKTDETRIQSIIEMIEELKGKSVYISTKMDGSSATFYKKDGVFGVCSRNLELKESEGNKFWNIARTLDIESKLDDNFCIQGELVGPGIQKNRLCLNELKLYVFNVYDIVNAKFLDYEDMIKFCSDKGLTTVPIEKVCEFNFTLEQLIELAKGLYPGTNNPKEGIVIRTTQETYSKVRTSRSSFKVLNNDALLQED